MRLPIYGLRTGILSHLIFLIIAAMLLINVVMVKFSERDLIQAKVHTGRLLIHAIEQNLGHLLQVNTPSLPSPFPAARAGSSTKGEGLGGSGKRKFLYDQDKKRELAGIGSDPLFRKNITQLLVGGGFSEAAIINPKGDPVFTTGASSGPMEHGLSIAREAMETGIWSIHFRGSTWGVFWANKKDLWVSAPLLFEGQTLGGITIRAPLTPIYQTLRKSEKVILLYILLDSMILVIVGIYLLSRIVVRPIHKLLKMAEDYKEGDIIPSFGEASRNEIGKLSRSLSIMLNRLDENKKELKAHISSLEKANKELQQAQNEIIRSEKFASVGRLAAGIAHEIGNPIGIILGYLELIRKGDIREEERDDFLSRIDSEITRINQIIRNLLDFSRPSKGQLEKTHAHDLIMNTVNILKPQPMMDDIRINLGLKAPKDTILADPNQLQQVFLNIIINSADALAGKDPLNDKDPEKEITIKSKNTGHTLELRFMDNGPGFSEEELVHVFDPFYTTKEPGKGTGLGLSVCYRIIEGLKGTIHTESSFEKGANVIIALPLYENEKGE